MTAKQLEETSNRSYDGRQCTSHVGQLRCQSTDTTFVDGETLCPPHRQERTKESAALRDLERRALELVMSNEPDDYMVFWAEWAAIRREAAELQAPDGEKRK